MEWGGEGRNIKRLLHEGKYFREFIVDFKSKIVLSAEPEENERQKTPRPSALRGWYIATPNLSSYLITLGKQSSLLV